MQDPSKHLKISKVHLYKNTSAAPWCTSSPINIALKLHQGKPLDKKYVINFRCHSNGTKSMKNCHHLRNSVTLPPAQVQRGEAALYLDFATVDLS